MALIGCSAPVTLCRIKSIADKIGSVAVLINTVAADFIRTRIGRGICVITVQTSEVAVTVSIRTISAARQCDFQLGLSSHREHQSPVSGKSETRQRVDEALGFKFKRNSVRVEISGHAHSLGSQTCRYENTVGRVVIIIHRKQEAANVHHLGIRCACGTIHKINRCDHRLCLSLSENNAANKEGDSFAFLIFEHTC